jgi:nucleotidyltransferase substrate binding protein (TIGR01987 family)
MVDQDVRWKQRFKNFTLAFKQLTEFIEKGKLNKFEEQGLIQCFEYNYELSWNLMKDFYEAQGESGIQGSRDAFRLAFNRGLIEDGKLWMEMVQSRILTSHSYHEDKASEIIKKIQSHYYEAFKKLKLTFEERQT